MSAGLASHVFDPTDRCDLIELKERARSYLRDSEITDTKSGPSTALILAGGGGKGAYEAGCLLALWDCGLRQFQAVAGTSVGGLNATLFKRLLLHGDRDVVLKVWSDLSFGRVLKGSPLTVVKLLLYIPVSILSFQNLPKLNRPRDGNLQIEMERPWDWIVQIIQGFISFVIPVLTGGAALVLIALTLGYLLRDTGIPQNAAKALLVGCIIIIPILCRWAGRRLGVADNGPLRQTVATVYDEKLRVGDPEVICTLATVPPGQWSSSHATYPTLAKARNKAEAIDLLVQTAALPEIFPMKKLHDHDYVDGGVEDNIPILGVYPIQPQRVFVVHLNYRYNVMLERRKKAKIGWVLKGDKAVWDRDTALKLWEGGRLEVIAERRGERWEGPLRSWFWALELVPIIPSRDLGNIITGTLNFSRRKARSLMALGYKDTLNVLLEWQPKAQEHNP